MCDYESHISTSQYNWEASQHNIPEAIAFFKELDQHVLDVASHLGALPELTATEPFYFVASFLWISLRQMRNAFILLLRRMSYDAMLVFRVGLEATVFAYRVFKKPELAEVWARKNDSPEGWKEFSKEFRYPPFPDDMPFASGIKDRLDLLNNYWAHPNINYFSTAIQVGDRETFVHFFDHDNERFYLTLLNFLDSCLEIVACYRKMLRGQYPVLIQNTEAEYRQLRGKYGELKRKYKTRAGYEAKPSP